VPAREPQGFDSEIAIGAIAESGQTMAGCIPAGDFVKIYYGPVDIDRAPRY
jgi:hypothetical protein